MHMAQAEKDTNIFNEGDHGTCFFMIKQGKADVYI